MKLEDLYQGILKRDHAKLSQAITLMESESSKHWSLACQLMSKIKASKHRSLRIGISGPPGVGKSTFIEALGQNWLEEGKTLAVLAIDPSSQLSGGSILGDKTRMEVLSTNENAFVRPSASGGHLGGVNRSMPATLKLCEAAGFDIILVETVGVGQSS